MPKLRLSLEDLTVESFDSTSSRAQGRGTVRAHDETEATCFNTDCGTCYTVEYYCGESLDGTCNEGTCVCSFPYMCPETYDATCPWDCRTQGVYC